MSNLKNKYEGTQNANNNPTERSKNAVAKLTVDEITNELAEKLNIKFLSDEAIDDLTKIAFKFSTPELCRFLGFVSFSFSLILSL